MIDYVQVHMGDDDGIEFFGGTTDIRHVVVSGAADDSLDWDEGWHGRAQFVIVHQHADESDNGIEADNLDSNNDSTPRSQPTIYNISLIGPNDELGEQRGAVLRRGTWGTLRNAIFMGFGKESVDLRDEATIAGIDSGVLAVESSIFFDIGSAGDEWFADEPTDGSDDDDDAGFVELDYFTATERSNSFGEDPMLVDPYNTTAPDFSPAEGSPVSQKAASPVDDGFFDTSAQFIGAIEPGGEDWTAGWTNFASE